MNYTRPLRLSSRALLPLLVLLSLVVGFGGLVVGGFAPRTAHAQPAATTTSAESGTWTPTSAPLQALAFPTATLLDNGKILYLGSVNINGLVVGGVPELYDPSTGSWASDPGNLQVDQGSVELVVLSASVTNLANGNVLVVGGAFNEIPYVDQNLPIGLAYIYDPTTDQWSPSSDLNYNQTNVPRIGPATVLLQNGDVLVAGGDGNGTAELYDPNARTWTLTGSMNEALPIQGATLLPNGKVLILHNADIHKCVQLPPTYTPMCPADAELYDPSSGTWSLMSDVYNDFSDASVTMLSTGKVLVAGGQDDQNHPLASAELYDPSANTWTPTGSLNVGRAGQQATLLPNGQVFVAGGGSKTGELYDPSSGTWSLTASLNQNPSGGAMTILPNGQVLDVTRDSSAAEVFSLVTASGASVSATEGSAASLVVASGSAYVTGTPSASIDWGDGSSSAGTITLNEDGRYRVAGSHTYSEEGTFAVAVTVSGSGGPSVTVSGTASVADAALSASTPTATTNGKTLTLSTAFTDADPQGAASDYSASISWGDGSSGAATIGSSGTSFTALGSHKYKKHGTYTVTVTITDAGGSTITQTLAITV
jgi:hypothetical protein